VALLTKSHIHKTADGLFLRFGRIVVPKSEPLKQKIMHECHDSSPTAGHVNARRTLANVLQRFYWRGMHIHVSKYCETCTVCK
jgi:hypothetical protein